MLSYIKREGLMRPGDRLGLAVSGGADSVALLRLMLELRDELGVVLGVLHFNHKIRGAEAEADERFVAELAAAHALDFDCSSAETAAHARKCRLSLEAAGRELRYAWFRQLLSEGRFSRVATAHTLDDQAETVLLRILRGTGTRGLAGIYPQLPVASCQAPVAGRRSPEDQEWPAASERLPERGGAVVRPLLQVRRAELREYLDRLGQAWREDASNLDVKHTRNRLRRQLLPTIEREFNPSVVSVLADMAEVARAEEECWQSEIGKFLPADPSEALDAALLRGLPLALQRRLVRAFAARRNARLEFPHVEKVLDALRSVQPLESKEVELPAGIVLMVTFRELKLLPRGQTTVRGYEYRLGVPGEVRIAELDRVLRVTLVPLAEARSRYNQSYLLDLRRLAPELVVRNWHPGDRFWLAGSKAARKLKELLLRRRIAAPDRSLWPVVVSGSTIAWVPGLGPAADFLAGAGTEQAAVIEEVIPNR